MTKFVIPNDKYCAPIGAARCVKTLEYEDLYAIATADEGSAARLAESSACHRLAVGR
jgi:hypothetical protein